MKQVVTLFSTNIAVSNAVSKSIWGSSHVIPNPYEDRDFYRITTVEKSSDLIFVGRLVSEKGVDILLQALARLQKRGVKPSLTIVGSGPEERNLRELSEKLDLAGQVTFVGEQTGVKLNQLLNAAKIMVVPSRREGFGVVALEGIACDCVVVGSNTGGLPEAIGRCGETFMSGSSASLADVLDKLLTTPNLLNKFLKHVDKHLRMHKPGIIGDKYAAVFQNAKHGTRKPH